MQNSQKIDRRILHTKKYIRDALFELISEKPVEKITITELCAKADINRNTFYKYYYTPKDVLESIENEFLEQVMDVINSMPIENPTKLLETICGIIYEKRELCRILLSENGDHAFVVKVKKLCQDIVLSKAREYTGNFSEQTLNIMYNFAADGSLSVIKDWIVNEIDMSPDETAATISTLTSGGILSLYRVMQRKIKPDRN